VGLVLLGLVVLDATAIVVFSFRPAIDHRAFADAYHGAAWTLEYFDELAKKNSRWQPYVYWVGAQHTSKYINVDSAGFRKTTGRANGRPDCKHPARIFMFGGSTMWGIGARDDETIASWVQKMLDARHLCAEVTNMGEDGYVSTQEVLLLAEQIRSGNVPDLAVFFDGYNDVFAAEYNNAPGLTYNEETRSREFNLWNSRRRLFAAAAAKFVLDTGLAEMAKKLIVALAPDSYSEVDGRLVATGAAREDIKRLAKDDEFQQQVVRIYLLNKAFADALALRFGFRVLTYWQPSLLDKNQTSPFERLVEDQGYFPEEKAFDQAICRRISTIAGQHGIHDMSGLFRDKPEPYYIDEIHVTGEGNRLIAAAMMNDITAALEQMTPKLNDRAPGLESNNH
jgi:hypothetical protein